MPVTDHLALQRQTCSRFHADFLESPPYSKLGLALASLAGQQPVNGLRLRPDPGTSGWFIWAGEHFSEAPDFFSPLHVVHLPKYCPAVIPYLGLPPGWRFLIAPGHEDAWFDPSLLADVAVHQADA